MSAFLYKTASALVFAVLYNYYMPSFPRMMHPQDTYPLSAVLRPFTLPCMDTRKVQSKLLRASTSYQIMITSQDQNYHVLKLPRSTKCLGNIGSTLCYLDVTEVRQAQRVLENLLCVSICCVVEVYASMSKLYHVFIVQVSKLLTKRQISVILLNFTEKLLVYHGCNVLLSASR